MVKTFLASLSLSILSIFVNTDVLHARYLHQHDQAPIQVTPSDYHFSQRVLSMCSSSPVSVYTSEDWSSMTSIIRDTIRDLRTEMGPLECGGMTLTSLSPIPDSGSNFSDIYQTILNTLLHLFIMRLDWTQPFPGDSVPNQFRNKVPCQSTSKLQAINNYHTRYGICIVFKH